MRIQKIFILVILLPTVFISYEKDVYHNLNDEERRYVVYETNDEILLFRHNAGDTIVFKVDSVQSEYIFNTLWGYYFRDHYNEFVKIVLESSDYTIDIGVEDSDFDEITFSLRFHKPNTEALYLTEFLDRITFSDIEDNDEILEVYESDTLLYRKDVGIVYFTSIYFEEHCAVVEWLSVSSFIV